MKEEKVKTFFPKNIKEYDSGEYQNSKLDFEWEGHDLPKKRQKLLDISGVVI